MRIDHDTVVEEVHALHADLTRWLGTPAAPEALERFEAQQHRDFSMITLDGVVASRARLVEGLRNAGNAAPGLTIDIVDIEVLHQSTECVAVRFREVHHRTESVAERLTSAVLLRDADARNGLRWRAIHETAAQS